MTLDEIVDLIASEVRKKLAKPPKPAPIRLIQTGKTIVTMLHYKLTLPPATASDVTKWELEATVNGTATTSDVTDGMTLDYNSGDVVSLKLREYDDVGNVSEWSDPLDFTAADTIPPSKPGQPAVQLVGED